MFVIRKQVVRQDSVLIMVQTLEWNKISIMMATNIINRRTNEKYICLQLKTVDFSSYKADVLTSTLQTVIVSAVAQQVYIRWNAAFYLPCWALFRWRLKHNLDVYRQKKDSLLLGIPREETKLVISLFVSRRAGHMCSLCLNVAAF